MKDFQRMATGGYPLHILRNADDVAYLRSPQFGQLVQEVSGDPDKLAELTIKLLDEISLDPLAARQRQPYRPARGMKNWRIAVPTVHDFIEGLDKPEEDDGTVFVMAGLHHWTNPLGYFSLSKASPMLPKLIEAIEKNLASEMFKAAMMARRLENTNHKRFDRFEKAGRRAYDQTLASFADVPKPAQMSEGDWTEHRYQTAANAVVAATQPLTDRMYSRFRALFNAACSELFQGNATEGHTGFALKYLRA